MKKLLILMVIFGLAILCFPQERVYADADDNYLAEISYNEIYHKNNSIVVNLQVWVDKAKLTEGMNDEAKMECLLTIDKFYEDLNEFLIKNDYNSKLVEDYLEIELAFFASYTDMYIANERNGYEKGGSPDFKMGFFFDTWTSYKSSVFYGFLPNSVVGMITASILTLENVKVDNIAYVYNYCTKYSQNYISSNADKVYKKADVTVHSFIMGVNSLDREIVIKQHTPNQLTWYGLVIIAGGIFVVVTIILIKRKKV